MDRPVAKSAVRALKAVADMTVPATTGCPEVFIWNVSQISLIRMNHLSEITGMNRHSEFKLFAEFTMEVYKFFRWNTNCLAMR